MKQTIKLVFLVLLPLLFTQCEESTLPQALEESPIDIPFKLSDHNLDELINSGYNSDIVLLHQNSFLFAKSLVSLYEETDYNKFVKETYDEYNIRSLPFSLLFKNKEYESAFNTQLSSNLRNPMLKGTSNASSTQELYSTFSVESRDQEPTVHLINPEVADFNLPPIISPGLEVEDDSVRGIIDCIVAWYEDEFRDIHQIVISEEEALTSKWPVFVISTIDKKDETKIVNGLFKNEQLNLGQGVKKGTAAINRFSSCEYRLNEQFESSGNCEFCIVTYKVEDTGYSYLTDNLYSDNRDDSKKIADVSFSNIGVDLTHWEDFCPNLTPYSDFYVFFNTFERDWQHSLKNIGTIYYPYYNQPTLWISGNMESSSNWYCNDPSSYTWSDRVDLADIESTWAEFYESDNGHLKIWRVD